MKLLYVIHQYFPACHSGTEQYCLAVSREARRRGDDVTVLSLEPDYNRRDPHLVVFDRPYDDFTVLRLRYWGGIQPNEVLRDYENPLAAAKFGEVLDSVQPEAIHFFHLRNLGSDFLDVACDRGIRTVVNLMDFWYLCPRFTLLRSDGSLCEGPPDGGRGCVACAYPDLQGALDDAEVQAESLAQASDRTPTADTPNDRFAALIQRKHWRARSGVPGSGSNRHGANSDNLVIRVPPGTVVIDADGGYVLKDLDHQGSQVTAAQGGRGGKGNTRFKSSTNRAPREATLGTKGERRRIIFELKVIADVGLVGKPNAGKSTLLSRVSRARPEVADYPFTTKIPNLGIVQIDADRSLVMADIPGLIEGAHAGAGLGHEFLRHVERTRVLVHLVEPSPMDGTDPVENYLAIRKELEKYDPNLAQRPELVAVSKAELPDSETIQQQLAKVAPTKVLRFSAVTGEGLNQLMRQTYSLLHGAPSP